MLQPIKKCHRGSSGCEVISSDQGEKSLIIGIGANHVWQCSGGYVTFPRRSGQSHLVLCSGTALASAESWEELLVQCQKQHAWQVLFGKGEGRVKLPAGALSFANIPVSLGQLVLESFLSISHIGWFLF